MSVARYFPALVKYGDRVYVFDDIKEPEEYGSPVAPFDKPDPNYTTIASETTLPISPTTVSGVPTTLSSVGTTTVTSSPAASSTTSSTP